MSHAMLRNLFADFFWGSSEGRRKKKRVAWSKACKPTAEGGLGVRDIEEVKKALHMKFA